MPSCIHQTLNADKPCRLVEAKGVPLSVRIASGRPDGAKQRAKREAHVGGRGGGQAATHEQRATEVIGDGQRIAVLPVAGFELAFEIGGPHLIRAWVVSGGATPGWVQRAPAALATEQSDAARAGR